MKDGIALQFSWYFEIRNSIQNIQSLLYCYVFTRLNSILNVWHLIDQLECHANLYKWQQGKENDDQKNHKSNLHAHLIWTI